MNKTSIVKKLSLAALLTVLLGALLCVVISAETYSGECGAEGDNLTWTLDTENGEFTIGGTGEMEDYTEYSVPWYSYRKYIKSITIENGVTRIGNRAFYNCYDLANVTISESVTRIGSRAFYYCSSLTCVTVPESMADIASYAFWNCENLDSITILSKNVSVYDAENTISTHVIIRGYIDSTAQTYAKNYNRRFECIEHTFPEALTYDGAMHWYVCEGCRAKKDEAAHQYADVWEGACTVCDYVRAPFAYEGTFDGLKWGLTEDGDFVVVGTGAIKDYDSYPDYEKTPWYSYRDSIKTAWIGNGVTGIGSSTFEACKNLESVVIPSSVTSIGTYAFRDCVKLTGITLPDSVKSIGTSAFAYCSALTSATIGSGVTSLGDYAFYECANLKSVTLGDAVTGIGERVFYGCNNLASVTIPDNVTSIGDYAFYWCSNLTQVSIPDRVARIGDSAFSGCSSLTDVIIPDSVTSIGCDAFFGCDDLTSITVGNGVKSIGDGAFGSWKGRTAVYISDVANWCGISFGRDANPLMYAGALYLNGALVTDLIIPDGVTSIGAYAFHNCDSLTSVTIPDSVTSIGYAAFASCANLTGVAIGNSVTNIGHEAFCGCSKLTNVTIPESVRSISSLAFCDCSRLKNVVILSKNVSIYNSSSTISDSATICGYAGSTAKAYAQKYGRTFVTLEQEALDISYQITVGSASARAGKTVTVNVTFADTSDIKAIGIDEFRYDSSALRLTSARWIGADKAELKSIDLGLGLAMLAFAENTSAKGLTLSLTFSVYDYAAAGDYDIGFDAIITKMDGKVEKALSSVVNTGTISVRGYDRGDVNGDEIVNADDAIHLLRSVLFTDKFSINQSGDMNGDGYVNSNDAIHLLRHVLFPTKFPLS